MSGDWRHSILGYVAVTRRLRVLSGAPSGADWKPWRASQRGRGRFARDVQRYFRVWEACTSFTSAQDLAWPQEATRKVPGAESREQNISDPNGRYWAVLQPRKRLETRGQVIVSRDVLAESW